MAQRKEMNRNEGRNIIDKIVSNETVNLKRLKSRIIFVQLVVGEVVIGLNYQMSILLKHIYQMGLVSNIITI